MDYAIWIIIVIGMLVIEASTVNLLSIWFAVGALGAVVANLLGAGVYVQIMVFLIVSGVTLGIAWPFIKKYRKRQTVATNYDMLIGQTAIVTDEISNEKFAGAVRVAGKDWSAVSDGDEVICEGEKVLVKSISGVKLVVDKIKNF